MALFARSDGTVRRRGRGTAARAFRSVGNISHGLAEVVDRTSVAWRGRRTARFALLFAVIGAIAAAVLAVVLSPVTPMTAWRHAPWNDDAQAAKVDPASARMIAAWVARGNVQNPKVVLSDGYAFAWTNGGAADPRYDVRITRYRYPLDKSIPVPRGTETPPGGDAHLSIYDTETGRVHDFWKAVYDPSSESWRASSGVSYAMGGSPPAGTGSVAAGIPALALAIWPEEIRAGKIDHALAFTGLHVAPHVFRYPATHTDGRGERTDLSMGSWLRLPASVQPNSSWPAWVKVVFTALQQHGMYLTDSGGSLALYGVDPVNGGLQWSDVGLAGPTASFPADFPWTKLQLLSPPSP
jgi:hypothetical protein